MIDHHLTSPPGAAVATDDLLPSLVVGARRGWFPVLTEAALERSDRDEPHDRNDGTTRPRSEPIGFTLYGDRFDVTTTARGELDVTPSSRPDVPGLATIRRWGMVWVWADPSVEPESFPAWPDVAAPPDGDGFEVFVDQVQTWQASALRVVDNLLDTLHPAFVHVGTFGDPSRAKVIADTVELVPGGLWTSIAERSAREQASTTDVRVTLSELLGPFTVRTRAYTGPGGTPAPDDFALLSIAVPCDDATTNYVRLQAFDPRVPRDPDVLRAFSARVLAEDRPIVESLVQPLPLRPGGEVHLRADLPTIAYRRYLSARQRGTPWPPTDRPSRDRPSPQHGARS